MLGLRVKRNITRKEVIIEDPKYPADVLMLADINSRIVSYSEEHKLVHLPNPIKVFFNSSNDHEIEDISQKLETVIEDLGYTKDRIILGELNHYPILVTHAHTRPFEKKWMNIISGLILPLGVFFYLRMCRFRLRLYKDLHDIRQTSDKVMPRIIEYAKLEDDETIKHIYNKV